MFRHYIKLAYRNLIKYKTQNLISILGISVGILIFSLCTYFIREYIFGIDREFPNYHKMIELTKENKNNDYKSKKIPLYILKQIESKNINGLDAIAYYRESYEANALFENNTINQSYKVTSISINHGFTNVFSIQTLSGNIENLFERPDYAIISRTFAHKIYGNENPIGKTFSYAHENKNNNTIQYYTIIGIVKDLPKLNSIISNRTSTPDIIHSIPTDLSTDIELRGVALLAPAFNIKKLNKSIEQIDIIKEKNEHYSFQSINAETFSFQSIIANTLTILICALVLLSALTNFINFIVTSFFSRTRILVLHKGLGAGFKEIFLMIFFEIALVLFCSWVLSLALSELIVPFLPKITGIKEGNLENILNISDLFIHQTEYILIIVFICAFICIGITIRANQADGISSLRKNKNKKRPKLRLRSLSLGFQFFISFIFFTAATAIVIYYYQINISSLPYLSKKEKNQILEIPLNNNELEGKETLILNRIKTLSGIQDILLLGQKSLLDRNFTTVTYINKRNELITGKCIFASSNFTSFFHLPLSQDLQKTEAKISATQSLINILKQDSLDISQVIFNGKNYEIGEILPDFDKDETKYSFCSIFPIQEIKCIYLKCHPKQLDKVKKEVETILKIHQKDIPEIHSLQERIEEKNFIIYGSRNIFLVLSIISLILTILGTYSMITVDAIRRQKEIAIRKINGASHKNILTLFGKLYIILLAISSSTAFSILWLTLYYLSQRMPLLLNLNHPLFWISNFMSIILIVFITIIFKIIKIAKINPAEVIKNE